MLWLLALWGCGPESPTADASADAASPIEVALPEPVRFGECKPGFVRRTLPSGVEVCDATLTAAATCPAEQVRFVDDEACHVLGPPCPVGEFPSDEELDPDEHVLFVRPTSSVSILGEGSREDPYSSIAVAAGAAQPGDVLLIAAGRFRGPHNVTGTNLTVRGTCVSGTVLTGALSMAGRDGRLERLTVAPENPDQGGLAVSDTGEMRIAQVRWSGSVMLPIETYRGTHMTMREIVVERSPGAAVPYTLLNVSADVHVDIARAVFRGAVFSAISAGEAAEVTLDRVAVFDTTVPSDAFTLGALSVETGASIVGSRVLLDGGELIAALAAGPGSRIELEDSVIRNMHADVFGHGAQVRNGAHGVLRRVFIEDTHGAAITAAGTEAAFELEDVAVHETRTNAEGDAHGVVAIQGGAIQATRLAISCTERASVLSSGENTTVTLIDADISGAEGCASFGVVGEARSHIEASRVRIRGTERAGISFVYEATGHGEDLTIGDVASDPALGAGRGVNIYGGQVELSRVRITNTHEAAVAVTSSSTTSPSGVERIVSGTLSVDGLAIADVAPPACAPCDTGGFGISATPDTIVDARHFTIERAATCGVLLDDASLDLHDGEISGCEIGACMQNDYDLMRLENGVAYRNNAVNLDATRLPVPGSVDPIGDDR